MCALEDFTAGDLQCTAVGQGDEITRVILRRTASYFTADTLQARIHRQRPGKAGFAQKVGEAD